jgi:trehalose 6-phosphate phosphatase
MTSYLFATRNRSQVERFALSNTLLVFDFDGTLAPIVESPQDARISARTKRLLTRVARLYSVIVISGRSLHDVSGRLDGVPLWEVAGNHGAEPWGNNPRAAMLVQRWVPVIERRLCRTAGIVVEDKRYSVAIHYRKTFDKQRALRRIQRALGDIAGFRILGGKDAVNLIPRGSPNKGVVLERAGRMLKCDGAIYVGDDDTDEDAFGSAPRTRLLSIRVGRSQTSRAQYHLNTQAEIDRLLQTLIAFRDPASCRASNASARRISSAKRLGVV